MSDEMMQGVRPARHARPKKKSDLKPMADGRAGRVTITGAPACGGGCGAAVAVKFEGPEDSIGARVARAMLADPWCGPCGERRELEEMAAERTARVAEMLRGRLERSGIPERWRTVTFDRLEQDEPRAPAFEAAGRWARGELRGLLLHGPVGRGKTVIAAAAGVERVARSNVRWRSVAELLMRLRMPFDSPEYAAASRSLETRAGTALVFDDLDKLKPTEHAMQPLYVAINGWIEAGEPLLVTMNRSLDAFAAWGGETFGEALASRLAGYCDVVEVAGRDRRLS